MVDGIRPRHDATRRPREPEIDYPTPESGNKTRMGRPPLNVKPTLVRLGKGIPERIDAVLRDHESRAAFIRKAVDLELRRRERGKSRPQKTTTK